MKTVGTDTPLSAQMTDLGVDRKYLTLDASDVAVVVPQETSTGHD
jgi:hypothetical protein